MSSLYREHKNDAQKQQSSLINYIIVARLVQLAQLTPRSYGVTIMQIKKHGTPNLMQ